MTTPETRNDQPNASSHKFYCLARCNSAMFASSFLFVWDSSRDEWENQTMSRRIECFNDFVLHSAHLKKATMAQLIHSCCGCFVNLDAHLTSECKEINILIVWKRMLTHQWHKWIELLWVENFLSNLDDKDFRWHRTANSGTPKYQWLKMTAKRTSPLSM